MMADPALDVNHLSKQYGTRRVVCDLSLTVPAGEIFGILGPNGAGKTTSIKMMIGLTQPTTGQVVIAGYDVWRRPRQVRAQFGVVLDMPTLYDRFTVEENLRFFRTLYMMRNPPPIEELIPAMGLDTVRQQRVRTLSKGWKQRVQIARALVGRPSLVFLDEPSSGLDPHAATVIHHMIRNLADQGIAVILTTHDMIEAAQLCHRVAILDAGNLVTCDTPNRLVARYRRGTIVVTVMRDGNPQDEVLPWRTPADQRALCDLLTTQDVVRLHSQEPSLGEVYQHMTGSESAE